MDGRLSPVCHHELDGGRRDRVLWVESELKGVDLRLGAQSINDSDASGGGKHSSTSYRDSPITSMVNHHVAKSSALTKLMPAFGQMAMSACVPRSHS